jgi:hypothetical protein
MAERARNPRRRKGYSNPSSMNSFCQTTLLVAGFGCSDLAHVFVQWCNKRKSVRGRSELSEVTLGLSGGAVSAKGDGAVEVGCGDSE